MQIDDRLALTTPEGATLTLLPAGPLPRMVAYGVDLVIRLMVFLCLLYVLSELAELGQGLLLILVFGLEWFYPVLFEVLWRGQTPGKRLLGLAVVQDNGAPVTYSSSLVRNLLRTADMFPGLYLAGFLCMISDRRFRRIGDLAAGTLVIHQPSVTATAPGTSGAAELPPDWELDATDRLTLTAYLDRLPLLSSARQAELAAPLFPELSPLEAADRLAAQARFVRGQP